MNWFYVDMDSLIESYHERDEEEGEDEKESQVADLRIV